MPATVVTPAQATQLATLAALKAELSIGDTSQDVALNAYLDQASALIDRFCDRVFAQTQWLEVFRLRGGTRRSLVLSERPVTQVESVNLDGVALSGDAIDLDETSGILYSLYGQSCAILPHWCGQRVAVIYTAGFLLPGQDGRNLPADVERACLITARALYYSPGRGDPLIRSEVEQGVGSTSYLDPVASNGGLPIDAASMLQPYMRPGIG